ncbi:MAG: formamidopyrimidine-DNA glycosylase [Gammaproteobacteria bacterium]|nr:formamidopyrimidine-DNA glycosylase [Gammaproteobacteria bacterium]
MPELPDITVYVEKLDERVAGSTLETIRIRAPFLLRSVDPPLSDAFGRTVTEIRRIGKRIAFGLDNDCWLVLHLMVAGRLHWRDERVMLKGKQQLAAFDFSAGTLLLTEAGTKKRASLFLVRGEKGLAEHDPGGLEPLACDRRAFAERLLAENRTLKRALTNPRSFSGIGNAYSDEILHAARLSPIALTRKLSADETDRLFDATQRVLREWCERLRQEASDAFPAKVTAFRKEMAVHGKFGKPCAVCKAPVQRIRYKDNETNYCANCQTGGKVLADRSLSRLLKDNWPRRLEE